MNSQKLDQMYDILLKDKNLFDNHNIKLFLIQLYEYVKSLSTGTDTTPAPAEREEWLTLKQMATKYKAVVSSSTIGNFIRCSNEQLPFVMGSAETKDLLVSPYKFFEWILTRKNSPKLRNALIRNNYCGFKLDGNQSKGIS